ncbi:hypothetical protein ACFOET_21050 [Parapedobacter deserti]|uniref:Uncharacterized protein n=1 Tax=Parapedobacter deserti TaxID=1912957 RepID=A0ABV7JSL6_9SPHI
MTCSVLALNGDKDLQVAAQEILAGIAAALQVAGNNNVTIKELPGLNHLFQESKTGLPAEYSVISQTISPAALQAIAQWLDQSVHKREAF